MIRITLPIRTMNPLNGSHGHWARKAKLRKQQRDIARHCTYMAMDMQIPATGWQRGALNLVAMNPLKHSVLRVFRDQAVVTITRVAPSRGLDPHDGLGAALKGIIDGVADALGLKDDRDPRVTWKLEQRRGNPSVYAVEIRIEPRAAERTGT